ncbi:MAG: hypothetical protein GY754_12895 [bacterium]|nr:hypothetical protein [bacterium]
MSHKLHTIERLHGKNKEFALEFIECRDIGAAYKKVFNCQNDIIAKIKGLDLMLYHDYVTMAIENIIKENPIKPYIRCKKCKNWLTLEEYESVPKEIETAPNYTGWRIKRNNSLYCPECSQGKTRNRKIFLKTEGYWLSKKEYVEYMEKWMKEYKEKLKNTHNVSVSVSVSVSKN